MRISLPCPACGHGSRFLVVEGKVRARCVRCGVMFEPRCEACGARPGSEALTGLADPACEGCGAGLALVAGPVVTPFDDAEEATADVGWGALALDLRYEGAPYRDSRPSGVSLRAPRARVSQRVGAWAVLSTPAIVAAPLGQLLFAGIWAGLAGLFVATVSMTRELVVTPHEIRATLHGVRSRTTTLEAGQVREVWWAGRGGDCSTWARTDEGPVLLFDGLTPAQARALTAHVGVVIGLDVDDRRE